MPLLQRRLRGKQWPGKCCDIILAIEDLTYSKFCQLKHRPGQLNTEHGLLFNIQALLPASQMLSLYFIELTFHFLDHLAFRPVYAQS